MHPLRGHDWIAKPLMACALAVGLGAVAIARPEPRPVIRCEDVAAAVGLALDTGYGPVPADGGDEGARMMQRNMGHGAAVGDYDRDGDLDVLVLTAAGLPMRLFSNLLEEGDLRFSDVTASAGLGDVGLSRGAEFVDLDGDGWLDLVVVNDYVPDAGMGPSRLWRNNTDGTFTDVTAASGFDPAGYIVGGLTATDVDRDGLPDLYVTYWTMEMGDTPPGTARRGVFPGENRLFLNQGGFAFEDGTRRYGLAGQRADSFAGVFHDFDGDGRLDLYQAVDHSPDRYFTLVDGRFTEHSDDVGVGHVSNDMGVAVHDVDDDGRDDILVTNVYDPEENFGSDPPGNILLVHDAATRRFADRASAAGVQRAGWGWGAVFADLDLDGRADLVTAQGFDEFIGKFSRSLTDDHAHVFRASGPAEFRELTGTGCDVPGDQRTLVAADFDRDGRPDLLTTQVDGPPQLLSNLSPAGSSVTVVLDSPGASGLGAVVEVDAGARRSRYPVLSGTSYLSGSPQEVVAGLGEADRADEVRVLWPDGTVTVLRDVPAGSVLRLASEPAG